MAKVKIKPTIEESFAVGKLVGTKETLEEILELINEGSSLTGIRFYAKARIKSLVIQPLHNTFKQKDSK